MHNHRRNFFISFYKEYICVCSLLYSFFVCIPIYFFNLNVVHVYHTFIYATQQLIPFHLDSSFIAIHAILSSLYSALYNPLCFLFPSCSNKNDNTISTSGKEGGNKQSQSSIPTFSHFLQSFSPYLYVLCVLKVSV